MRWMAVPIFFLAARIGWAGEPSGPPRVAVPAGVYAPFFRDEGEKDRKIPALWVDRYPVTNREFAAFVREHPEWKKSRVKPLFARPGYLEHWTEDDAFPVGQTDRPVTNVSWFAARKFCESREQRLLTIAEWEYVSDARDPRNLALILEWYGKNDALTDVRSAAINVFGVAGIHGLIWEWVEDFSAAIIAGDSRNSGENSKSMFCGGGALKAKDPAQYATFMRFAHRSSLKANSVGRTLGFRCANTTADLQKEKQ